MARVSCRESRHLLLYVENADMTSVIFDIPIRFNHAYLGITVAHPCVSTPARVRWYVGQSTAVRRPEYCCMPGQSTAVCQARVLLYARPKYWGVDDEVGPSSQPVLPHP